MRPVRLAVRPLEDRTVPSSFTVYSTADAGPGTLRQAVLDANAHPGADTVKFVGNLHGTITLASQVNITDDLTVRGPGADRLTVSGGAATRVFAVLPAALAANPYTTPTLAQVATAPEVTLSGLTVANGLATNAAGYDPANPGNPGFAFGGGLFNLGGTVHLDQVRMAHNRAAGAITAGGAASNEFGGTLTVSRSEFDDNASTGFLIGVGGAVTSDLGPAADGVTGPPTVTIDRSSFTGNTAQAQAGHIGGAAFTGLGAGGAVINITGAMTVTRSAFADNAAVGGTVALPGVVGGGPGFGGAINSSNVSPFGAGQSTLDVSRSTFVRNTATGGDGGAPGLPGGEGAGGAVYVTNGGAASLSRNAFVANTAAGGTGGAEAAGGNATGGAVGASGGASLGLELDLFADNTAAGGAGTGSGAAGVGRGGALGLNSVVLDGWSPALPTATSTRDLYVGNRAVGGLGGGIYNEGTLTLTKALVAGNRALGATGVGGGVYNLGTIGVTDSLIAGNFASTSNPDTFGV